MEFTTKKWIDFKFNGRPSEMKYKALSYIYVIYTYIYVVIKRRRAMDRKNEPNEK